MRKQNAIKEIAALLVCSITVVAVLCTVTRWVTPKQHDYGATWGHYRQEEPDSIDVLFVGSSMTYCDIVPAVFWEESGATAYVMAGPELTVPMEKYYVREALKTQSPKVVFVELSSVFFGRYMNYTKTDIGQMPWGMNRLQATLFESERENRVGLLFPMLFYHDRWDDLTEDDTHIARYGYAPDDLAGYTFLDTYKAGKTISFRDVTIDEANIARNLSMLEDIWSLCRERNITPVFYVAPAAARMPETEMNKIKKQLAALDGAVVVDFNDQEHFDAIGAELDYDFYDNLHYNAAGAEKFSVYLARWCTENLKTEPTKDADKALWDSRRAVFAEKAAVEMTVREE